MEFYYGGQSEEFNLATENDFEICVFGSGSSYTVSAKEITAGSTCVISVGKYGTPQRSGC